MSETERSGSRLTGPRDFSVVQGSPDIRHAVQRLRWFSASFRGEIRKLSEQTGLTYDIDDAKIAAAFVGWLREFRWQRPSAGADLQAFSCFAAGLMLRELIRHQPLKASPVSTTADSSDPSSFWPEGYAYVEYCLSICSGVLYEQFGTFLDPGPELRDIRVWESFKENVEEDSALAVGFFQLFCGMEPNWTFPSVFSARLNVPSNHLAGDARSRLVDSPDLS